MEPKAKQLPTTARLLADHAHWFGKFADASIAIAEHISKNPPADPKLEKLLEGWYELRDQKVSRSSTLC